MEIESFLGMPTPRRVPPSIAKRAGRSDGGRLAMRIFGTLFLALGLLFSWIFLPFHLPKQWKLDQGPAKEVGGTILDSRPTNLRIDEVTVQEYDYLYRPAGGPEREGRAYTTGSRWQTGDPVKVRYLMADPAIAVPDGGRMGRSSTVTLFVLIFPIVGATVLLASLFAGAGRRRLLTHGVLAMAKVTAVEPTSIRVNEQLQYKIHLTRSDDGVTVVKRSHDAREVALAKEKLHAGSLIQILHDPHKTKRLLFPETWN